MHHRPSRILFLAPYPFDEAPSQRYRFEQYFPHLVRQNLLIRSYSFYGSVFWESRVSKSNPVMTSFRFISACAARVYHTLACLKYDRIFIHREVCPAGPPVFEWIIAKVLRKKIIYDFDDAIWLTDDLERSRMLDKIKWRSKVALICKWSYKVSCGNEYLRKYALEFNKNSYYNPTTIDLALTADRLHQHTGGVVVIGWTGSHTTLKYLYLLTDLLDGLTRDAGFRLLIICNKRPEWNIKNYEFIEWNKTREIDDLMKIDIGLMPLPENSWTLGKCGFKALQYLSLGIPALVSPLEVNKKIVDHGLNGYLCKTIEDWSKYIVELAGDPLKRIRFGEHGRKKVESDYCTASNLANFLGLLE